MQNMQNQVLDASTVNYETLFENARFQIAVRVYEAYKEMGIDIGKGPLSKEEIEAIEAARRKEAEPFLAISETAQTFTQEQAEQIRKDLISNVEKARNDEEISVPLEEEIKNDAVSEPSESMKRTSLAREAFLKIGEKQQEAYLKKLEADLKNSTITNSVKPGVTVPNKREKGKISKAQVVLGVGAVLAVVGIISIGVFNALTLSRQGKIINPVLTQYKQAVVKSKENYGENVIIRDEEIYDKNGNLIDVHTERKVIHWHNVKPLVAATKEKFEDPVVAFYMLYYGIDGLCRQESEFAEFLTEFNKVYGTNYTNFADFLEQNHFGNAELGTGINRDFRKYVFDYLNRAKEEGLYNDGSGYSYSGR